MLKSGDIVVQDYTMVNNKNYKDNKECRLSVVLFEQTIDDESFVCTCPVTSGTETAMKQKDRYYSSPYLIFGEKKYSCIKLNSAHVYPRKIIHETGISLDRIHIERIIEKIVDYAETDEQEELYNMIKNNLLNFKRESLLSGGEVKIEKERKRKNKQLRKQRRQNAKRGINN